MTNKDRLDWLEAVSEEYGSVMIYGGLSGRWEVDVMTDEDVRPVASGSGVFLADAIDACALNLESRK